jgi:transcriptional regulator with XRE-family HTH domain
MSVARRSPVRADTAARHSRAAALALERGRHLPSLETLLILGGVLLVAPADLIRDLPVPQERRAHGRRSSAPISVLWSRATSHSSATSAAGSTGGFVNL